MEVTRALGCGSSTNSTADYSMFGFLYGTFPSAPSVFLYSTQYGVGEDLVSLILLHLQIFQSFCEQGSGLIIINQISLSCFSGKRS